MSVPLGEVFGRWGRPEQPVEITPQALAFLTSRVGRPQPRPGAGPEDVTLPPSEIDDAALEALRSIVGEPWASTSDTERLGHLGGCSLGDYVARREGVAVPAPDVVVRPGNADEVVAVLQACGRESIAVVPFGGGTSVVGGVTPLRGRHRAAAALDLSRMDRVVRVDEANATVTVEPGITGPTLERLLAARGFTWGHLPQSWERASVGGYIATRSAGQASSGYGRSDDTVIGLEVATPRGVLRLGRGPASAAGPDLRQLLAGSEGVLGVITQATLRIRHLPRYDKYEGLMFPRYEDGIEAFRVLSQAGLKATVMRLSDPAETATTLAMSGPGGALGTAFDRYLKLRNVNDGSLAILGWEDHVPSVGKARREAAWGVLRRHGAVALGSRVGNSWRLHRYGGPYLRDELLDRGYIVETLETATTWTALRQLHDDLTVAITDALAAGPGRSGLPDGSPYVMSHVSHVYETGASLYLTVIATGEQDRLAQWRRAKAAAGRVITESGATITHHHAVGTDHLPWMAAEVGDLGTDVLRAVKDLLDPAGVLNPGKLIG